MIFLNFISFIFLRKKSLELPLTYLEFGYDLVVGQEDPSQEFALASIWLLLLAFGSTAIFVPVIYVISLAFADNISSRYFFYSERLTIVSLEMVNKTLTLVLGCLIGFPLAYASSKLHPYDPKYCFSLEFSCSFMNNIIVIFLVK